MTWSSLDASSAQAVFIAIIKPNHLKIQFKAKQYGFVRFSDHFPRVELQHPYYRQQNANMTHPIVLEPNEY
jgi:hypothetical protein